jgi:hypothetical protein
MLFENITIIDDAVPVEVQDKIEQLFISNHINWTFNPSSLYVNGKLMGLRDDFPQTENTFDTPMFTHISGFVNQKMSDSLVDVFPVVQSIPHDMTTLIRVKTNITLPAINGGDLHNPVHVDYGSQEDYLSAIYYINDSDGDTFIFNEKNGHQGELTLKQRVSPKKGRLVVFNGNYLHAGGIPTRGPRLVMNINGY